MICLSLALASFSLNGEQFLLYIPGAISQFCGDRARTFTILAVYLR